MAAQNMNTIFVDAFGKHQRIRTTNFRGSTLYTSVHTEKLMDETHDWPNADQNSILYVCLVPFTCSIKEIAVTAKEAITALKLNVGVAGINPDGSFTVIKDDIIDNVGGTPEAKTKQSVWDYTLNSKTLYEMLHNNQKPIEAFKKYVDDKYGVLFFKIRTREPVMATDENAANVITETNIDIQWVEQSPSATSNLSVVIPGNPPMREAA